MIKDRKVKKRSEYKNSRYRDLDILVLDSGIKVNETYKPIDIFETREDSFHQVKPGEKNRLDLIADKYYNDAKFWWIIALANDIQDPFYLEQGIVLRIPPRSIVFGRDGVVY